MASEARFEPIYQVFASFMQRCLVEDRSLLWPGEEIWTITNLEHMRRRFVEGFIQGGQPFRTKLEAQLSGAPEELWALAADCFYVYGLPSSTILFQTKKDWITWAAGHAKRQPPPEGDGLWEPLRLGFASTGQKYNLKHAQLRLLILLALEVKAAPDRAAVLREPARLQALLDGILEDIPVRLDRANDMRNAILYMAFPEEYEPVLSSREKDAILQHYGKIVVDGLPADREEALRRVRRALAPRFAHLGRPFDYYLELREEWRPSTREIEKVITAQVRGLAYGSPTDQPGVGRVLRERGPLAGPVAGPEATGDDPDARRVLHALRLTRNVILTGPPGVGKTYIAREVALRLASPTGEGQAHPTGQERIAWITLHPSYSYEDFVEGLRPVLAETSSAQTGLPKGEGGRQGESGLAYTIRPGVFREVCEQAARDPEHLYVLVIDEINRGNLSKILGELITLIEDDKRGVMHARLAYSGAELTVPPNLVILGTMNTTDRSIALLDIALRRRFAFVEIEPRPDLLAGATVETEEAVLRLDALLTGLNNAITRSLGREFQIGHSAFLRVAAAPPEERLSILELVWNHQVLPQLSEVFYNRRDDLAEILAPFVEEGQGEELLADSFARLGGDDLVVALSRISER